LIENVWILGETFVDDDHVDWQVAGVFLSDQDAVAAHESLAPRPGWGRWLGRCEVGVLVAPNRTERMPDVRWLS